MREELKPCPFCGGKPVLVVRGDAYGVRCTCNRTALVHTYGGTEAEAIAAWNTRSAPPQEERSDPLGLAAADDNHKALVEAEKEIRAAASLLGIAGLNPHGAHDDETLAKAAGLEAAADILAAFQSRKEEKQP